MLAPPAQFKSVAERYAGCLATATGTNRLPRRGLFRASFADAEPESAAEFRDPNRRDHRLQRLEAVLFLAREPLTTRKLSQFANLADGTEARTLIRRLNDLYDTAGRAFRVERVSGGYQLMSRPQFASWVRRLEHVPRETRLSAPALETLAVIAYRQPVLRADIEAVRGVNCGEILRQLMERDLVKIGGRSEELGRPYLYATTATFLRTFGLDSIHNLPEIDIFQSVAEDETGDNANMDEPVQATTVGTTSETENGQGEESEMPVLTLADSQHEEETLAPAAAPVEDPKLAYDEDEDEYYDDDDDDNDDNDDFDDYDDDFDDDDDGDDDDEEDDDDLDEYDDEEWQEVEDDDDEEWEDDSWDEEDDDDYDDDEDDEEENWD